MQIDAGTLANARQATIRTLYRSLTAAQDDYCGAQSQHAAGRVDGLKEALAVAMVALAFPHDVNYAKALGAIVRLPYGAAGEPSDVADRVTQALERCITSGIFAS
jgi:hypothetical protein